MSAVVVAFSCASALPLVAQKPALNHSTPETWPRLGEPSISPDGRYAAYIMNVPNTGSTLMVRAVDRTWQRLVPTKLNGIGRCRFTEDSRALVFGVGADTVEIMRLGTDSAQSIGGVVGFEMPKSGNGEWLVYQLKDSARTLVLHNLHSGAARRYPNVARFELSENGRVVVMQVQHDSLSPQMLVWLETATDRATTIAQGREVGPWLFDDDQQGVAFLVTESAGATVRYYASGMDRARTIADTSTPGIAGFVVGELVRVSPGGQDVFLNISPARPVVQGSNAAGSGTANADGGAQVEIVSTMDEERASAHDRRPFLAVVHAVPRPRVVRLQQAMDHDMDGLSPDGASVLFESDAYGKYDEYAWRVTARPNVYLVSTRDGSRTLLRTRFVRGGFRFNFSRSSKYVIWYDPRQRSWYTHDISRRVTRNVTRRIPASMEHPNDYPDVPSPLDLVGWLANDEHVLVQSYYDLWAVDPRGRQAPINLTRGIGQAHHIRFRYVDYSVDWGLWTAANPSRVFRWGDTLLLSAFDERTKANGFYQLVLNENSQLTQLRMDARAYCIPSARYELDADSPEQRPRRAQHAERYILRAQSATEYPNYYFTTDFRELTPITRFAPQTAYNWYRTELVHWRLPDGHPGQGVLYKPEDFDPRKRYPVIIFYYDLATDGLNMFVQPALSEGPLNVAWFVSNGYLVFIPDIVYYDRGHPGRSALSAVESGAAHLARYHWVNAKKMGIQGHSYGGFETYYIATHTSRFAAAAPAEGTTEIVSDYTLGFGPYWYERRQGRIGASLWERPDLYIDGSPIFSANHVRTPILMLANSGDGNVPRRYGQEMLVALERLGKPAWLLDYKNGTHTLDTKEDQLDYSIRLGQFFDYYLKDAPPPRWMTTSVSNRASDVSLELDTSGKSVNGAVTTGPVQIHQH